MSLNKQISKVLDQIDTDLIAANTLRLIKEASPTCFEEAASKLYCNILKEYGLEAELQYIQKGRPNVLGKIRGEGTGPTLLLGGHIDTIPVQGCVLPRICGRRVYGRGASDMKGSLVSMAAAAGALKKAGVRLKGDLLIAAWVDHEDPDGKGMGPKEIAGKIRSGELRIDGVIITEGPFDSVAIAQGGAAGFTIHISGRKGAPHTISCFLKSNPILWGSMAVEELYKMDQELESQKWHHLIPVRPSIQLGIFQAGDFYNRLPEDVKIVGTIRWDPGDKFEQVEERLRQRLRGLENKIRTEMDPEIEMRLEVDLHRNSSEIKNDDALVKAVQTATCEIIGHPLPLAGWRIVADQPFFVGNAGVPALYYGSFTDDDNTAHSNNESVSLDRLVTMAKVYVTSALFYCGYHT